MSRPYALPVGPTRFAESNTSIPPPDPRSRTVWPGSRVSRAVGLPQPSDAATASAGRPLVSASEYRFDVIGSPQPHPVGPQQPVLIDPFLTESAMAPYFSRTACWMSDMNALPCICKNEYRNCRRSCYICQGKYNGEAIDRDGKPVQGAGRCDPPPDPGTAADRRGLRLRHPREPEDSPAEGVAAPRLPSTFGSGG